MAFYILLHIFAIHLPVHPPSIPSFSSCQQTGSIGHQSIIQAFYWLFLFVSHFRVISTVFYGSFLNFRFADILLKLTVCTQFSCALASSSFLYILTSLFRSVSHSQSCALAYTLGIMLGSAGVHLGIICGLPAPDQLQTLLLCATVFVSTPPNLSCFSPPPLILCSLGSGHD